MMKKEMVLALIEELIGNEKHETASGDGDESAVFVVGSSVFIRTVTYHCVGRVSEVRGRWVLIVDASWIADSGRFTQAIRDGALSEVEPVGCMWLNTDTVVDVFPWAHALPMVQK
jgi:hypothetical protein